MARLLREETARRLYTIRRMLEERPETKDITHRYLIALSTVEQSKARELLRPFVRKISTKLAEAAGSGDVDRAAEAFERYTPAVELAALYLRLLEKIVEAEEYDREVEEFKRIVQKGTIGEVEEFLRVRVLALSLEHY